MPRSRSIARGVSSAYLVALLAANAFAQTTAPATSPAPLSAADFAKALRTAKAGDVVLTSFAKLDASLPSLPLAITPSSNPATLVFSDRPEYFRDGDGIASQDLVKPGRIRFYTYHVPIPADGKAKRVVALFENTGDAEATLRFDCRSEPPIGGDYNAIAKEAMTDQINGKRAGEVVTIPPHGHLLNDRVEPVTKSDLLAHGWFDFVTDQPLRITVAQVTATDDLDADVATIAGLPKLPLTIPGHLDKSGRGVFDVADFDVALANGASYDTASGAAQVVVADGKASPWIEGVDGITGERTSDKGNYGVLYHMHLKFKSSDGRRVALLMTSARYDAKYCGMVAAAVRVGDDKHKPALVELPRDAVRFHGIPQGCVIGTFAAPAKGETSTIDLQYTPPGACCLPTPLLLVPMDE